MSKLKIRSIANLCSLKKSGVKVFKVFLLIIVVLTSCKTIDYESVGSASDYTLSETEKQEISYRLFVVSEIDENNMPLNNLRKFRIKNSENIYIYVNWFNLNTEKYMVIFEWLDENSNILDQNRRYKRY